MNKETIEFWLAVNDEGNCAVSFDGSADAVALVADEYGGAAFKTIKMAVAVELPTAVEADPVEITAEDGDEAAIEVEEEGGAELPDLQDEDAVQVPADQKPEAVRATA